MNLFSLKTIAAASLAFASLFLSGCATTHTTQTRVQAPLPVALSIGDVAKLIGDKAPDAEIVRQIQEKGLKSAANAADLDILLKQGASKEVIDAVLVARNTPTVVTENRTVVYPSPAPYAYGWGWPFSFGLGLGYYSARPHYYHRPFVYRNFHGRR